ncbi:AMP-binding protein [Xylophilus sp. GOD-11R]|uniref:AMP-binding protein n=1 Tax=Xylophilus sp. GOD-11R TaxID=3089814 RepID=UPI00298CA490|nr:AMP-binding protein [Xylophilus sp. GOD-11R]WPB58998.1 AMP-binding protein [Xylophilus sp. GOD-11R]
MPPARPDLLSDPHAGEQANLAFRLDAGLRSAPTRRALLWLERGERIGSDLTAADLRQRSTALARELIEKIPARSQMLLVMPPGPEFTIALLACLYAGQVAVPLPMPRPGAPADRLQAVVADADARFVLSTAEGVEALRPSVPDMTLIAVTADAPQADAPEAAWPGLALAPTDTVVVQYTSGSTRTPRGVALSGANIVANAWLVAEDWQLRQDELMLSWLPHYHDMGLMGSLLFPLLWGVPVVQMSPLAFVQKPVRWLRAVQAWGATMSGGPAFAFALCLETIPADQHAAFELRSWRLAYCGAEPVPAALMQRFREAFGPSGLAADAVFATYGLAEAALFVAGRPGVWTEQGGRPAPASTEPCLLGEATRPFLRIVDPETLAVLPDGEAGEIWACGPSIAMGYLTQGLDGVFGQRLEGDTSAWLRTGDIGLIDGAVLRITGRRKDILIAHGGNVAAADVEWLAATEDEALNPHAAAAFNLYADGTGGIALLIETRDGRAAIGDAEALSKRIIAVVRAGLSLEIELLCFVKRGALDRTSSGKIRRQTVAERVRAGHRYTPATMP